MSELKNILIIGNGFDLELGYKTKYEDFLSFLNVAKNSTLDEFIIFTKTSWGITDVDVNLIEDFYNLVINEINNNFIISYFLNYHIQTLSWADFEIELEHIGNCLEGLMTELYNADETDHFPIEIAVRNDLKHHFPYLQFLKDNEIFHLDFVYLLNKEDHQRIYFSLNDKFKKHNLSASCNFLKFTKDMPSLFVKKLLRFSSIFDAYLQIESQRKAKTVKTNYAFDSIITYNYTDFCKRFVKNPFYINGKINDKYGSNIIFGVDSGVSFKTQVFDQITKRIQRPSQGIKTSTISFICRDADNLYIYGHSLAPADKDSLKLALLQMKPRMSVKRITIFYKSENDQQTDLMTKMNLSNNLKIILDDDFDDLINIIEFKDSNDFFNITK